MKTQRNEQIYVAWSRAREDVDSHTTSPVHIQRVDDGDDDRTLCGCKITAEWEMDVWDAANLQSWAGCMKCGAIAKKHRLAEAQYENAQ